MNRLKIFLEQVDGGIPAVAEACGVSTRAVYKWLSHGRLPRTDYTGETNYAEIIASLEGHDFGSEDLLSVVSDISSESAA